MRAVFPAAPVISVESRSTAGAHKRAHRVSLLIANMGVPPFIPAFPGTEFLFLPARGLNERFTAEEARMLWASVLHSRGAGEPVPPAERFYRVL